MERDLGVNDAAKELGVTRYYCNRNPRSLELLGMAPKPRGFETAHRRVDYYHRYILNCCCVEHVCELGAYLIGGLLILMSRTTVLECLHDSNGMRSSHAN